jgi:hypothetical protein
MNDLIRKATEGSLTPEELDWTLTCLEAGTCDRYQALLVIGRAGAVQHRRLVERYLDASDQPMLARLALLILCAYWGLGWEYRATIEAFLRKVDWDEEDDVRLAAIDIAGWMLASHNEDWLLHLLIEIFQNPSEEQILREAAYCSLARASGKRREDLPPASRHFDLERDVDPQVLAYIAEAKQRCAM